MSNDDEDKFPLSVKKCPKGQTDESNDHDMLRHNRREFLIFFNRKKSTYYLYQVIKNLKNHFQI